MKSNTFLKIFLTKLIFTILLIITGIIIKTKVQYYLKILQSYSTQLSSIQTQLIQNITDIYQFTPVLSNITVILQKAMILVYLIPLIIFILYCISQSIIFATLKEISIKKYIIKFSIVSLPAFLLVVFFIKELWNEIFISQQFGNKFIILLILVYIIYYFILLFHLRLKTDLKEAFKKVYKTHILKLIVFIPLSLILLILSFLYILSIFFIAVFFSSQNYQETIYIYIFNIIITILIIFYESFLIKLEKKY